MVLRRTFGVTRDYFTQPPHPPPTHPTSRACRTMQHRQSSGVRPEASPLTAHRSPLTAHRSPLTAHRSPLTAHRSGLRAQGSGLRAQGSGLRAQGDRAPPRARRCQLVGARWWSVFSPGPRRTNAWSPRFPRRTFTTQQPGHPASSCVRSPEPARDRRRRSPNCAAMIVDDHVSLRRPPSPQTPNSTHATSAVFGSGPSGLPPTDRSRPPTSRPMIQRETNGSGVRSRCQHDRASPSAEVTRQHPREVAVRLRSRHLEPR
jgi:hypothetical protein